MQTPTLSSNQRNVGFMGLIFPCCIFAGQWILQLSQVDSGERPHWAGPEVLHWWGQLWTGVHPHSLQTVITGLALAATLTFALLDFAVSDVPGWPEAQWIRHGRHKWEQKRIHRVRTVMFSILWSFYSKKKLRIYFFLICPFVFCVFNLSLSCGSLVIQWRFVNRVQKQMNAFLEVVIVTTWGQY